VGQLLTDITKVFTEKRLKCFPTDLSST